MESFSFGDTPKMADELLQLVIEGKKTATSWAASLGMQGVEVGKQMMIKDSRGVSRVIIETVEVSQHTFKDVDETIARDEGEGDLSIEYWRRVHEDYFCAEGTFAEDMLVYCERFKVIDIL